VKQGCSYIPAYGHLSFWHPLPVAAQPPSFAELETLSTLLLLLVRCCCCSFLHKSNIALAVCTALKNALEKLETGQLQLSSTNEGCTTGGPVDATGCCTTGGPVDAEHVASSAGPDLLGALLSALLNFSYSAELSTQLLRAGILRLLLPLLQRQQLAVNSCAMRPMIMQVWQMSCLLHCMSSTCTA
jgi:hypothetical protein